MADARSTLDLSRRLSQAVKAVKTYGKDHPQAQNALGAFKVELGQALAGEQDILFVCQGDSLMVQDIAQPVKDAVIGYLLESMQSHGMTSLTFQAGIPPEEIDRLVQLLAAKPEQVVEGNQIKAEFSQGYTRVLINSVRYVAITDYDAVINTLHLLPTKEESKQYASAILNLSKQKEKSQRPAAPAGAKGSGAEPRKGPMANLTPQIQELLKEGGSLEAKKLILEQLVNSLTPGAMPLKEQIREAIDSVPDEAQPLIADETAETEISAAIVARQLQLSDDMDILRRIFRELAPRPKDVVVLLEAVAGALRKSGGEVSPQTIRKAMEFLPQAQQMAESSRGNVLVVDGDPIRRSAFRKAIADHAFQVDTAGTAKEAIERVAGEKSVDAIVMDIHLPDKRGGVILSHLMQSEHKVPVVIAAQSRSGTFEFEIFSYPRKKILQAPNPDEVAQAVLELADLKERRHKEPLEEAEVRAKEIQEKLMPQKLPLTPGFDLAYSTGIAGDLGSDFLDVFEIGGGKVAFILGKVSEKGVGASMVMMRLRIATRLTISSNLPPRDSVAQVNRLIAPHVRRGTLVSLVYGSLDLTKGLLSLVDCALRPPLLYDPKDGSVRGLSFREQGLPMGTAPEKLEPRLLQEDFDLSPGGILLFSTPGVFQTRGAEGKVLEESSIADALRESGKEESRRVIASIEAAIAGHRGTALRSHDTTLLALRRELARRQAGTLVLPPSPGFR